MPKIVIDGREIEAKEGDTVLTAALDAGIHIPHFCFHPNLEIAGNCRMCLVEIEKVPKLQIACGTKVREGMVVTTKNDRVKKAREAVLEFLLINHPLDCPICDQCGECKLQDYCFEYGKNKSRFAEEKHTFDKIDIGPNLTRDQNRCIHCTRCIRFMRDVAGSEEIALTERSGHTVVGPYMDKAVESPFSINAADVCPVGALTSTQFRFKARSWLMEETRTLCPGCARGCNIKAWVYKGELRRVTPERNDHVNITWLCDAGRLSAVDYAKDRVLKPLVKGEPSEVEAARTVVVQKLTELKENGGAAKVAIIGSSRLTNEDNFAINKLAGTLGTEQIALSAPVEDDKPFAPSETPLPEWFIRNDRTPNARGARDVLNGAVDTAEIIKAVEEGDVTAMLVFGADPAAEVEGAGEALKKLDLLMVADTELTATAKLANVVLPESSPFEKEGTFTNEGGRVQQLSRAVSPLGGSCSTWETASALAKALGAKWTFESAAKVFDAMAREVSLYKGLALTAFPAEGVAVHAKAAEPEAAETKETEPEKAD